MSIFNSRKEKEIKKKRSAAILELRKQLKNNENIVEFNIDIEGNIDKFMKTRQIEKLVEIRRESLANEGGATFKYSPFVESVVNFICLDMDLLDIQGDTDHTFKDSVDNLIFVLF